MFEIKLVLDEVMCEGVEQGRMRGGVRAANIVDWIDQSPAEELTPVAIDDVAREEGILRRPNLWYGLASSRYVERNGLSAKDVVEGSTQVSRQLFTKRTESDSLSTPHDCRLMCVGELFSSHQTQKQDDLV